MPIKQSSQGPPPKELKRDDGKVEDIKPEGESVKNEPETQQVPPTNDLFYKKDSERQMLSGNEDDIDEIVSEVKPNKKVIKVSESDFETDVLLFFLLILLNMCGLRCSTFHASEVDNLDNSKTIQL